MVGASVLSVVRSRMQNRRAGFTLLELLVVIAIVAVLAATAMGVLGKIEVTSRNIACQNKLRQIGAAMLAHAGEHDGYLPTAGGVVTYNSTDPVTGLPGWTQQLEPYLGKDRAIFVCPASHNLLSNNAQYSYFMGCRAAYLANDNQYAPVRLSRLQASSKYFIAGDVAANTVFPSGATDADKDDYTANPAFTAQTRVFHGRKSNLVFADGHVGAFAKFDRNQMTVRYNLRADGTGYDYSDP